MLCQSHVMTLMRIFPEIIYFTNNKKFVYEQIFTFTNISVKLKSIDNYIMSIKSLIILGIIGICSARQINEAGLSLIEEFEGFYPNFYNDPVVSV